MQFGTEGDKGVRSWVRFGAEGDKGGDGAFALWVVGGLRGGVGFVCGGVWGGLRMGFGGGWRWGGWVVDGVAGGWLFAAMDLKGSVLAWRLGLVCGGLGSFA